MYCISGLPIHAIPVLDTKHIELHKYAASIAAIDPLRLRSEYEIEMSFPPLIRFWRNLFGGGLGKLLSNSLREKNREIDASCTRYETRVQEILQSYDLQFDKFNSISSVLKSDKAMRRVVLFQAYLYKLAADLSYNIRSVDFYADDITDRNRKHSIKNVNPRAQKQSSNRVRATTNGLRMLFQSLNPMKDRLSDNETFESFCQALYSIEAERLKQRLSLQESLGISLLPMHMCDPSTMPAMSDSVQKACGYFPIALTKIVSENDIDMQKFIAYKNHMSRDFFFRQCVKRRVKSIHNVKKKND